MQRLFVLDIAGEMAAVQREIAVLRSQ